MTTELNHYAGFNQAMAEFQKNYSSPKKDRKVDFVTKTGQHIKYDYADLENIQSAIREAAAPAGLSWNTAFESKIVKVTAYGKEQDHLYLLAHVCINHKDGGSKTFAGVPMYTNKFTDPQSVGAIKTYAERYALTSAFGIASGEDDEQMLTDNNQGANNNGEPSREELEQELQQEIMKHKNFLMDNGIDLGGMNKWMIEQENVDNINQVPLTKQHAYLLRQVQKIKTNAAKKEYEEKRAVEQQSLMNGNTTTTVDWESV